MKFDKIKELVQLPPLDGVFRNHRLLIGGKIQFSPSPNRPIARRESTLPPLAAILRTKSFNFLHFWFRRDSKKKYKSGTYLRLFFFSLILILFSLLIPLTDSLTYTRIVTRYSFLQCDKDQCIRSKNYISHPVSSLVLKRDKHSKVTAFYRYYDLCHTVFNFKAIQKKT